MISIVFLSISKFPRFGNFLTDFFPFASVPIQELPGCTAKALPHFFNINVGDFKGDIAGVLFIYLFFSWMTPFLGVVFLLDDCLYRRIGIVSFIRAGNAYNNIIILWVFSRVWSCLSRKVLCLGPVFGVVCHLVRKTPLARDFEDYRPHIQSLMKIYTLNPSGPSYHLFHLTYH